MATNDSKREQAKALFMQGVSIGDIALQIGMSRKQVGRWKTADRWEALRDSLPKPEPIKVVSFDRTRQQRNSGQIPSTPPTPPENMDLLAVVDGAIATIAAALGASSDLRGLGGAAGGLVNLIKLRREIGDDAALAAEILKRYKTPSELREFFVQLKEAEWGGKGA